MARRGHSSSHGSASSSSSGSGTSNNSKGPVNSVPVVFAILYGLMFCVFVGKAIRNPRQVFIMLLLFCTIRVAAFVMYAKMESLNPLNSELSITIMGILFSVGFFALLYSAYILVLDREMATGNVVKNPISRITSNRYVICFALAAAVVIGIAAFVCDSQGNENTFALQETYIAIFLAVTMLIGVQTVFQVIAERTALKQGMLPPKLPGKIHNMYIPCQILILLLVHEVTSIVTINLDFQSEVLWWVLWIAPEFLAVSLFGVPDLVPKPGSPPTHGQEANSANWSQVNDVRNNPTSHY